jgi:mono/diheme cytochrome c family protein
VTEVRFIVLRNVFVVAAVTAVAVAAVVPLVAEPQMQASAPAFTAEQVAAGRVAYARSCASCHMPDLSGNGDIPQLSGGLFLSTWRTRSTKDLVDYLSATMPPTGTRPGPETLLAISAYVLQSNGAVTGEQALSGSTAVPIGSLVQAPSTP